ncbi:hypothetical protein EVAR_4901_1 [Eumeta japonica]|uniref:Uncharacterized protein n=1 Tax=Eumeta variegata TaxID=151549 RepID=A0A4C1Y0I1_EUMVA|nr:hypothetical protein EVAR_4901_1 [Eumeta japonica]
MKSEIRIRIERAGLRSGAWLTARSVDVKDERTRSTSTRTEPRTRASSSINVHFISGRDLMSEVVFPIIVVLAQIAARMRELHSEDVKRNVRTHLAVTSVTSPRTGAKRERPVSLLFSPP